VEPGESGDDLDPGENLDFSLGDREDLTSSSDGSGPLDRSDPLRLENGAEFAEKYKEAQDREGDRLQPGQVRIDGARTPWAEHPLNPDRDRYLPNELAQRRMEGAFVETGGCNSDTLKLVNTSYLDGTGRCDFNCGECARSVASTLDGQPRAAHPLEPDRSDPDEPMEGEPPSFMEDALGRPGEFDRNMHYTSVDFYDDANRYVVDPEVAEGYRKLEQEIADAGPGAHAVVGVYWKPDAGNESSVDYGGHWYNIANIDGRVLYIDAQDPDLVDMPQDFFEMRKADVKAVTWIRSENR
jgi:hypothetical protein